MQNKINNVEVLLQGIHQQLAANNFLLTQICAMQVLSNDLVDLDEDVIDLAEVFDELATDSYNNGSIEL